MEAHVSVPLAWHYVRLIRQRVGDMLNDGDPRVRTAAMMVASELVENAIKYAEDVPAAGAISFSLVAEPDHLRVSVSNGSRNKAGVRELARRIDEVSSAPDKAALYMKRLEELMADPRELGKLGIYRIAFEGEFELECSYVDEVVTITATRSVQVPGVPQRPSEH